MSETKKRPEQRQLRPEGELASYEMNQAIEHALRRELHRHKIGSRARLVTLVVVTLVSSMGFRALLASPTCPQDLGPLKRFCAGQPALAADVNANFKALKDYYESACGPMTAANLTQGGVFKGNGAGITALSGAAIQAKSLPVGALSEPVSQRLVPVGTVLPYGGATAPTGWAACEGGLLSKVTYKKLFAVVGCAFGCSGNHFRVPDLRGKFVRGWQSDSKDLDKGDPQSSSRAALYGGNAGNQIGSFQFDSLKSHSHKYYRDKTTSGDDGSSPKYERHSPYLTDTTNTGGYETRPRNVYVNYIIKL